MSQDDNVYDRIYAVVRKIPSGRVTNYGAIARYIGMSRGARLVGWAMNNSHTMDVPAHRVVNRIGMLTGKHHFPGANMMKELLESEGVQVENDIVIEFDKLFWDPIKELPEDA